MLAFVRSNCAHVALHQHLQHKLHRHPQFVQHVGAVRISTTFVAASVDRVNDGRHASL